MYGLKSSPADNHTSDYRVRPGFGNPGFHSLWKLLRLRKMDEFLKVAITACIPAFTVIFGWGVNKAASIANSYVHNQFVQHCIQNAANAVFNAVSDTADSKG